jgi:dihydroflavonol-4-reductase
MTEFLKPTDKPILVTGALSFLGAHVVQRLLTQGYYVRGTVRASAEFPSLINHLRTCTAGCSGRLEIFQMDLLLDDDKWERVFDQVEYVFHLAAPHSCCCTNAEAEMLLPIVEGTRRILQLCQQSTTVKKLIYASCYECLAHDFDSKKTYAEADFNEGASLTRNAYAYCKTTAEKLVISFCAQPGCNFKLVSIVSGVLLGPPVGTYLDPPLLPLFLSPSSYCE